MFFDVKMVHKNLFIESSTSRLVVLYVMEFTGKVQCLEIPQCAFFLLFIFFTSIKLVHL